MTTSKTEQSTALTYEDYRALPVGTVVADRGGYWEAVHRHYVKTTVNTWSAFFHLPTASEIAEAVAEKRNNVSPCPSGLAIVIALGQ